MRLGYQSLPSRPLGCGGTPRALLAFEVEVLTEAGQRARYTALAQSSCAALLAALDVWGLAKISVSPRRGR